MRRQLHPGSEYAAGEVRNLVVPLRVKGCYADPGAGGNSAAIIFHTILYRAGLRTH